MTVSKRQILNVRTRTTSIRTRRLSISLSLSVSGQVPVEHSFVWLRRVKSLHAFGIRQISLISVCADEEKMCITVGYFLKRITQIGLSLVCFSVCFSLLYRYYQ